MSFGASIMRSMGSAFGGAAPVAECAVAESAAPRRSIAPGGGKGMARRREQAAPAPSLSAAQPPTNPTKPKPAQSEPTPTGQTTEEPRQEISGRDYTQVPKQLDEQFERLLE